MLGKGSIVVIFSVLLQSDIVISTGGFPKGFLNDITESAVVQQRLQSRWKWEVWDVVPGTHTFNLYVYNITNPTEVEKGAKPIFREMGPYVYIEHRIKFNVSVNLDLSVNFQRNFTYTFDKTHSNGTEEDLATVLNVPFIIFSAWASKRGAIGNDAVNSLIAKGEQFLKRKIRVGDLLFDGMDVRIYTPFLAILQLPPSPTLFEFQNGRYGVLKLKRGSNEGPFTVESGLKDTNNVGEIVTWDGNKKLLNWYGPTCEDINGTDGTVLSPYVSNSEPVQIFDVDFCRSIEFIYNHSSTFDSTVPTYVFSLNPTIFNDPRKDVSKICFCKEPGAYQDNCLKGGVIDVSSCRDDAPFVMSLAHFYEADSSYLEDIKGVIPLETRDRTLMSVQPRLGVVVDYSRRFQWNMNIQKYVTLDYFRNAKFIPIVFPILWNDDHFQLDQDKAELLVAEIANEMGGYGTGERLKLHEIVVTFVAVLVTFKIFVNT